MAVPTPAFTSDDITDSGTWTEGGSAFSNAVDGNCGTDTAIDFDGVDDFVERTGGAVVTTETEMSVSCWFKRAAVSAQENLLSQYVGSGQRQFIFRLESNGRVNLLLRDGDNTSTYGESTVAEFDDDVWHHVIATGKTGDVINIYIDGEAETTTTSGSGFTGFGTTGAKPRIGMRGDGGNKFGGIIDSPRIWTVELTAEEAAEEYANAQNCGVVATGNTFYDHSLPVIF